MSRVYVGVPDQQNEFTEVFSEYSAWTDFGGDRLHGIDPFDIFYCEYRMSRWAGPKNQTTDLGL